MSALRESGWPYVLGRRARNGVRVRALQVLERFGGSCGERDELRRTPTPSSDRSWRTRAAPSRRSPDLSVVSGRLGEYRVLRFQMVALAPFAHPQQALHPRPQRAPLVAPHAVAGFPTPRHGRARVPPGAGKRNAPDGTPSNSSSERSSRWAALRPVVPCARGFRHSATSRRAAMTESRTFMRTIEGVFA